MEYIALFVAAFLAATLLPLPSEVPLVVVVRTSGDLLWPVTVATAGNYLGACTRCVLARVVVARRANGSKKGAGRALALFRRYGAAALLFSWVPGDRRRYRGIGGRRERVVRDVLVVDAHWQGRALSRGGVGCTCVKRGGGGPLVPDETVRGGGRPPPRLDSICGPPVAW